MKVIISTLGVWAFRPGVRPCREVLVGCFSPGRKGSINKQTYIAYIHHFINKQVKGGLLGAKSIVRSFAIFQHFILSVGRSCAQILYKSWYPDSDSQRRRDEWFKHLLPSLRLVHFDHDTLPL